MTIAIDAGNTRIKWGVHEAGHWVARGALLTREVDRLASIAAAWPTGASVVACNVAGEAVSRAIEQALAEKSTSPRWLRASQAECGVRNGYADPERLGADRWAALIGARGVSDRPCLVVCAGTATTVDWLDAAGVFRGGLILPGVDLMRASLARNTAQLPDSPGYFSDEPRNTGDAIASGCLHAQVGAIERMFAKVSTETGAVCVLTGGAAPHIAPYLGIPLRQEESLILDGLLRFAASAWR